MIDNESQGIPSRVNIKGHPIHPMIIPFPISFLIGAFITDLVFLATGDALWAAFSFYLIGAGLVMGLVAGIIGAIDFFSIGRVRKHKDGWIHAVGNVTVLALSLGNFLLRYNNPALTGGVLYTGVILSLVVTGILVITGWYGGELAYRWLIGMLNTGTGTAVPRVEEKKDEDWPKAA